MILAPVDKDTAKRTMLDRGFHSFREWKKQNLEGQRVNKRRKRHELVAALEMEFERFIKANL